MVHNGPDLTWRCFIVQAAATVLASVNLQGRSALRWQQVSEAVRGNSV